MRHDLRPAGLLAGLVGAVACAVTALAGPGALAAVPSAEGAPDGVGGVELSVDGEAWTEDLTSPLLGTSRVWVPGDVGRASLLVRHRGSTEASGTVTVVVDGGPALSEAMDVRLRAGRDDWTAGRTAPLVVGPQQAVPVELEVAFAQDAGNATQASTVRLDVEVVLAGDGAVGERPAGSPGGLLPRTGVGPGPLLVLAGVAVVVGVTVRAARRRGADDG
ncbi:hypothetical protein UQW22_14150 [Isoptericola halotolerans]|uniref:hypothetical protein n=1 Tax=Isoptericola halotolerans TaxID=300560 RepID=UPI00388E53E6